MKTFATNFGKPKYSIVAAAYQPDQGQLRRTLALVALLLAVFLLSLATRAHAEEQPASCPVVKGGICSPIPPRGIDLVTAAARPAWEARLSRLD